MTHPALPIIIGLVCTSFFLFLLINGFRHRSVNSIMYSIGFLLLAIFSFFWLSFIAIGKAYKMVNDILPDSIGILKPRNPVDAYLSIFGPANETCVKTLNFTDQIVPRLDCCIWIEFKTCPKEIERIISLNSYKVSEHASLDTLNYLPTYTPRPYWWQLQTLGQNVIVFRDDSKLPNHDKILIISTDSSHGFYCDMLD
ncbi:hypothetical protein BC349_19655 [Flavihumibacter stibioxidans]|uniref:Uncharacterized protein n=1 Tax=Flavihumibacter stibioxidans TaxID=1834163 RepID=A0ABR7M824_9BACT|nr:hypothetical protein [Flavihumibacter stibioxidans]